MTKLNHNSLELSNSRTLTKMALFSSLEDAPQPRGLASNLNSGKFSQLERDPPFFYCHSNRRFDNTKIDNNGNIVELSKRIESTKAGAFPVVRQQNSFDLLPNKTAITFEMLKPRIDLAVMNRVLDRDHCVMSEKTDGNISKNFVFGSTVPTRASTGPEQTRTLGPWSYDVSKWEKSQQCSHVPGHVTYRPSTCAVVTLDNKSSSELSEMSTLSNFPDLESRPSTTPTPGISIGKGPRFARESSDERYKRFTGLLLSPDFDRKRGWGRSTCIKVGDHPRFKPLPPQPVSIVTPNFGSKASLERTVRDSGRYVGLYRQGDASRLRAATPQQSGYDPTETVSSAVHGAIRVKEPHRLSAAFKSSERGGYHRQR